MVTTSPSVDTTGATRLSRSHPRRVAPRASTIVATSTTTEASIPPATEIVARSRTEMVEPSRAWPTITAATARASDSPQVRSSAPMTFSATIDPRRVDSENVPAWTEVLSRLPKAENTLPRSPMAAGTSTSRPGRRSKVPVTAARVAPATKLVELLTASAVRDWVASGSQAGRARGATDRRGHRTGTRGLAGDQGHASQGRGRRRPPPYLPVDLVAAFVVVGLDLDGGVVDAVALLEQDPG